MTLDAVPAPPQPIAVVKSMTAEQAAAALLVGRPHGLIDRAEWHPDFAPTTDTDAWRLELVEKPVAVPGGCTRQRWSIRFLYRLDAPAERRLPDAIHAESEVVRGDCRDAPAYVPAALPPGDAVAALARLEAIARGRARVRLTCTDTTGSGLCAGNAAVRRSLARPAASGVGRDGERIDIRLDGSTHVGWSPAHPDAVAVRRSIPAPF